MKRRSWIAALFCIVAIALTMIDLHGGGAPPASADASTAAADPPNSASTRQPHGPPLPGEVRRMTIKQLGNFKYDPANGANLPADVSRLNGMTVRVTGYMIPMDQSSQITRFMLVPGLWTCCYGQPPEVQHTISVECPPGQSVNYISKPVVVEGKLSVGETKEDGYVVNLFRMSCDSLQPAPRQ
jgi:hypothetical protein